MATWYPHGYGPHPDDEPKQTDEAERSRQQFRRMQLESESARRNAYPSSRREGHTAGGKKQ